MEWLEPKLGLERISEVRRLNKTEINQNSKCVKYTTKFPYVEYRGIEFSKFQVLRGITYRFVKYNSHEVTFIMTSRKKKVREKFLKYLLINLY